jgi:hypothetical protein
MLGQKPIVRIIDLKGRTKSTHPRQKALSKNRHVIAHVKPNEADLLLVNSLGSSISFTSSSGLCLA